jgi:hypothetical protein
MGLLRIVFFGMAVYFIMKILRRFITDQIHNRTNVQNRQAQQQQRSRPNPQNIEDADFEEID